MAGSGRAYNSDYTLPHIWSIEPCAFITSSKKLVKNILSISDEKIIYISRSLRMAHSSLFDLNKNNIIAFKLCFIILSVSEIYPPKDLTVIHQKN